eukprot:Pgem_evm1s2398
MYFVPFPKTESNKVKRNENVNDNDNDNENENEVAAMYTKNKLVHHDQSDDRANVLM